MAIVKSEIILRKSAVVGDTDANGGRMSKTAVVDKSRSGMFPHFTISERTSGKGRYRKFFYHVANSESLPLLDAFLSVARPTPAGDRVTIFAATWDDTQADIPASPDHYGAASLTATTAAGASSLVVTLENSAQVIFRQGEQIRIWDGEDVEDNQSGEIFTADTVSKDGASVTIGLSGTLSKEFAAGSPVCSLLACGDVEALASVAAPETEYGEFDDTAVTLDSIGTIAQVVTLTFSSATAFAATSDVLGSLGTGNIAASCAPINPDYARPYLTVPTSAWSGSWEAGDTVTITTTPAAVPFWAELICPAGASGDTNDAVTVRIEGGTA
ncbi:hypothetical protein G3N56_07780 [Desulfovibrio sulfodismutans]|uniref:Uncharacterized protein n=1 Tax=Desulfolutivibrio sulfodismutans TaxID=63561 RepID=A0A7K3NKB2_9BACT|nr:hypothetical protein [Desulfolutivibrio sulfodismutans]NDY56641.1 hypothetical protein [Desulfolutivibrio sulfodismutans]QLA11258.1 hypothetical protein GD606_02675 [Desulfolutivibrio sulfodismutans DSM 3696]